MYKSPIIELLLLCLFCGYTLADWPQGSEWELGRFQKFDKNQLKQIGSHFKNFSDWYPHETSEQQKLTTLYRAIQYWDDSYKPISPPKELRELVGDWFNHQDPE